MSGICGILRLDDALPAGMTAMTAHLQKRGPEGTHHYTDGACALGHTLLATTPEALHETMPLTHAQTGCTITADLRIDNRDELITALDLPRDRILGDGEIVLRAYLHWGEECPKHLLGDFAFAIWDPRVQRLFCARDHMGMKQLIWHHSPGRVFAFASEPQAVLKAEGVPKRINEGRIADFLENYLEGIDYTSTFFEGVSRLPPAHCLTVDARGVALRRYWTLIPGPELKLGSDEEYAAAFLEVFTEAVRCRLRCNGPVGSMLSGGMDSGSVVAVASKLLAKSGAGPLHTFSCIGPDVEACIESRTIHASLALDNLVPTLIDWSNLGTLLPRLHEALLDIEDPFDAHMNLVRAIYLIASDHGSRVVLSAGAGDVVLAPGSHVGRLLRQFRFAQVLAEARGEAEFWGSSWPPSYFLKLAARQAFAPHWLRMLVYRRRQSAAGTPRFRPFLPQAAASVHLRERVLRHMEYQKPLRLSYAAQRARSMTHPALTVGLERYDRVAARAGIECRDPYMDRRLAEFCLRLPGSQLQHNGWRKYVQRIAMAGLLPDAVRWRKGKEHLGWRVTDSLYRTQSIDVLVDIELCKLLDRFVNLSLFNRGQVGVGSVSRRGELAVLANFVSRST